MSQPTQEIQQQLDEAAKYVPDGYTIVSAADVKAVAEQLANHKELFAELQPIFTMLNGMGEMNPMQIIPQILPLFTGKQEKLQALLLKIQQHG